MDLNRYKRAKIARGMEVLEGRRRLLLQGKLKPEDLDADEWRRMVAMDEIERGAG